MDAPVRLAVVGVGLVGRQHVQAITLCEHATLSAVVEPNASITGFLSELGVPWYTALDELLERGDTDGVILATPNNAHVEQGFACLRAGLPMLIEKPLASSADDAEVLVDQAEQAGIPLLVGHHRRHNPIMQKARAMVDAGKLGQIRAIHAQCWLYKPDEYFQQAPWRTQKGAGPIAVNLVHDVDLIQYLCGDVVSVQAQAAPSIRGFENEDLASALLRFENGVIGTLTVSDTVVSPWSWELTAGENPAYPQTSQSCYLLGGTHGSLSVPDLTVWSNPEERGWWQPIQATNEPRENSLVLVNQIDHFARVIRGNEMPLVSGRQGLKTLHVIEAIQAAAMSGDTVTVATSPSEKARASAYFN